MSKLGDKGRPRSWQPAGRVPERHLKRGIRDPPFARHEAKDGFTPRTATNGATRSKGNGTSKETDKVSPAHNVPLRGHENGKGSWYSHKLADGAPGATGRALRQQELTAAEFGL